MQELIENMFGKYEDFCGVDSREFEDIFASRLFGFCDSVRRQVGVSDRGDGRSGRVDFVVSFCGKEYGIEVDRISPRRKSVFKLKKLGLDQCFLVTRCPYCVTSLSWMK